jgi:hypothetical protein
MMDSITPADLKEPIPDSFPVAVLMQRSPAQDNTWIDYVWEAVGITVGGHTRHATENPMLVHEEGGVSQFLYSDLKVSLFRDQCESYYHNMMSPKPGCYIVTRMEEDEEAPVPFLVTMSFDEAHAYLEGDSEIFAVEIPPELYRWIEAYVIANYVAVKRKKRKRQDWRQQDQTS